MKTALLLSVSLLSCCLAAQRPGAPRARFGLGVEALAGLLRKYDVDRDGRIARGEYPRGDRGFDNLDRDGNGFVDRQDLGAVRVRARAVARAGETKAQRLPRPGDVAPDFELPMLGMKGETVKLSSFAGDRPVALIFGSYT